MSDPQFSHLANGCEATVTCLVEGPWRLQSTWGDVPSWLGRAYLVLVSTLLSPWGQGWKDSMVLTSRVTASLPFCTLLLPASLNICLFGDVPQQTRRSNLQAWLHSPSITWGVSPAIECSLPRQHRIREWWCHGVSFSHRRGAGLFPVWGYYLQNDGGMFVEVFWGAHIVISLGSTPRREFGGHRIRT